MDGHDVAETKDTRGTGEEAEGEVDGGVDIANHGWLTRPRDDGWNASITSLGSQMQVDWPQRSDTEGVRWTASRRPCIAR